MQALSVKAALRAREQNSGGVESGVGGGGDGEVLVGDASTFSSASSAAASVAAQEAAEAGRRASSSAKDAVAAAAAAADAKTQEVRASGSVCLICLRSRGGVVQLFAVFPAPRTVVVLCFLRVHGGVRLWFWFAVSVAGAHRSCFLFVCMCKKGMHGSEGGLSRNIER